MKYLILSTLLAACTNQPASSPTPPAPSQEQDAGTLAFTCDYPVCNDRCLRTFRDSNMCCECP